MQLDEPERGFGYRSDGPLDMRMGEGSDEGEPAATAADLVNELPEGELADVLFEYGQERRSRRIAAAIVRARGRPRSRRPTSWPASSWAPWDDVRGAPTPRVGRSRRSASRSTGSSRSSPPPLPRAVGLLGPGGRVVVLSYHSLEDGIVKRAFREDDRLRSSRRSRSGPRPRRRRGTRAPAAPSCGRPSGCRRRREPPGPRGRPVGGPPPPRTRRAVAPARPPATRPPIPNPPHPHRRTRRGHHSAFWIF